jgi:hypothetical protein
MLKKSTIGLVVMLSLLPSYIGTKPAKADDGCNKAIENARYQIESKNAKVASLDKIDMRTSSYPQEFPEEFPYEVSIAVSGKGEGIVLQSPIFLKSLSTKIILECHPVSLVTVGPYASEGGRKYGLTGKDSVEEFQCLPDEQRFSSSPVPWGYQVCL